MNLNPEHNSVQTFYDNVQLAKKPIKSFQLAFFDLEDWLKREKLNTEFGLELNPVFQRGHVWTEQQQIKFIKNIFRKLIDVGGLTIRFNCPSWRDDPIEGDLKDQILCIDGLQRLTAIRRFAAGEFEVCGYFFEDLPRRIKLRELNINIQMYDFQFRKDLLQFYLDINEGGTPHALEDLKKVHDLLQTDLSMLDF